MMKLWRAGGREFSLHGQVVTGVGHLGHDEAMAAGGREFSLHGQVVRVWDTVTMMKLWWREVGSSASMAEWLSAWVKLWRP